MTADWYAPNQQAVRPDGSGPAEEGDGGSRRDIDDATAAPLPSSVAEDELDDDAASPAPTRRTAKDGG